MPDEWKPSGYRLPAKTVSVPLGQLEGGLRGQYRATCSQKRLRGPAELTFRPSQTALPGG